MQHIELAEYACKPLLDFEWYNIQDFKLNQQEGEEVYYKKPDLLGGI
jgi:hypothetical protein